MKAVARTEPVAVAVICDVRVNFEKVGVVEISQHHSQVVASRTYLPQQPQVEVYC